MKKALSQIRIGECIIHKERIYMRIPNVIERHNRKMLERNFVCLSGIQIGRLWTFHGTLMFKITSANWRLKLVYWLLK